MSEVQRKIRNVRRVLRENNLSAVRFRGVDWFAWITGGANSCVILTSEIGIAEVLITQEHALVLTNAIESERLKREELTEDFRVEIAPWHQSHGLDHMVEDIVPRYEVASDRPRSPEHQLPQEFLELKHRFEPEEVERYRKLGWDASRIMTRSLAEASPEWSEFELAGFASRLLWAQGIHPTLILVAGEERLERERHPFPTHNKIQNRAMMVFCARRNGLYANLSRIVSFRKPTAMEMDRLWTVGEIESTALEHSRPGQTLQFLFEKVSEKYRELGFADEINRQHFGGLTGYLSREALAQPQQLTRIQSGSAVAWNPTLPGSKVEDTVLVTDRGLEVLTEDPEWPLQDRKGWKRPDVMVKT